MFPKHDMIFEGKANTSLEYSKYFWLKIPSTNTSIKSTCASNYGAACLSAWLLHVQGQFDMHSELQAHGLCRKTLSPNSEQEGSGETAPSVKGWLCRQRNDVQARPHQKLGTVVHDGADRLSLASLQSWTGTLQVQWGLVSRNKGESNWERHQPVSSTQKLVS